MKNLNLLVLFSVFLLALSHMDMCDDYEQSNIFDLEIKDTLSLSFPFIAAGSAASLNFQAPGATKKDYFLLAPLFADTVPYSEEGVCLDVSCNVAIEDMVTVTAFNCHEGNLQPVTLTYVLYQSKK